MVAEFRRLLLGLGGFVWAVVGLLAVLTLLAAAFGLAGLAILGLISFALLAVIARDARKRGSSPAIESRLEVEPQAEMEPPSANTRPQPAGGDTAEAAPPASRTEPKRVGRVIERREDPPEDRSEGVQPQYVVPCWHGIFRIDPRNHSRHTAITRLRIEAYAEAVPEIQWYSKYTGHGPHTSPRTAGPPVVEGADFVGFVPNEELNPRWTGWRLRFARPLHPGEGVDLSIVQEFRDLEGTFVPMFGVDVPVPTDRLVVELDLPPTAFPNRVFGYGAGAHPTEKAVRPIIQDKLRGSVRMIVPNPILGREYWLEWDDPPTGTKRGKTKSTRSRRDRKRDDLPFTLLGARWR